MLMRRGILIGYMGFRRVGLFVVVVVFCCCCCCFCCSWPFFSTSLSTRVTDWRARRGVPAISGQLCHVRRRLASSTAAVAACGSVPATKKTQVSFFFFGRGGGDAENCLALYDQLRQWCRCWWYKKRIVQLIHLCRWSWYWSDFS